MQAKWAAGMDRLFNRLSPGRRKAAMACLFLLLLTYSTVQLARSFEGIAAARKPVAISVPVNIKENRALALPDKIPKAVIRIIRYRRYLDSLGATEQGRQLRDSLLRQHPGLMDSLVLVERQYCR